MDSLYCSNALPGSMGGKRKVSSKVIASNAEISYTFVEVSVAFSSESGKVSRLMGY